MIREEIIFNEKLKGFKGVTLRCKGKPVNSRFSAPVIVYPCDKAPQV